PFPCLHTTNYDDLLEMALRNALESKRGRAVHAGSRSISDGARVGHLHGYFPYEHPGVAGGKRLAAELGASDRDYHRLWDADTARTNREVLQLRDSRAVLIVGMSLPDPNVRRLPAYLSEHRKAHGEAHEHFVILQHRPPGPDPLFNRATEELDED